jgi:hypothetical protein
MRANNEVSLSFRYGALVGSAHICLDQLAMGGRFFSGKQTTRLAWRKGLRMCRSRRCGTGFMPIATASEEGVDDFVRVYLLGVWIVGPLLLMIRSREPHPLNVPLHEPNEVI